MSSVWWGSKKYSESKGGDKNMTCTKQTLLILYEVFNVKFKSKVQHYDNIVKEINT